MYYWLERNKGVADMLVALDMALGPIHYGALGLYWSRMTFTAPGAHTNNSRGQPNPARAAAQCITDIYTIPLPPADAPVSAVYNAGGLMTAGDVVNAIPAEVTFSVDLRTVDPKLLQSLDAAIVGKCEAAAKAHQVGFVREFIQRSEAGGRPEDLEDRRRHPLVQTAVDTLKYLGAELPAGREALATGSQDSNAGVVQGIPSIAVGRSRGGDGHTLQEWSDIDSARIGTKQIVLLTAALAELADQAPQAAVPTPDPVTSLVGRLDLERYKPTIRGLTQFGDRLEGTDRNRAAIDWIEAQLRSHGCTPQRHQYVKAPPVPAAAPAAAPPSPLIASGEVRRAVGGSRLRGMTRRTDANNDAGRQPDEALRALNTQPSVPGPREQVYCTKVGTTRPDEMYIVGAHMDGRGFGQAANDNGSGTALVLELARIFSAPDVQTERSIRFALWNSEEGGLVGATSYVRDRAPLQGREDPAGSGRYPEPRWLGMIQHDMMLFDHGMPNPDGSVGAAQRPEADVNIEFQSTAKRADEAMTLAFLFREANEKYATDYPAAVGHHMTNTDSTPFMDLVPAISLRENERGMHIGAGWNPHWHQPTDMYATFTDKDFLLGLNAAQTTLGGVAQLAGATIK
jgi:acetylornithine deacetylase/succinyl-diaminopimelate desuccinylase-like protein